jgi:hypothetical protein
VNLTPSGRAVASPLSAPRPMRAGEGSRGLRRYPCLLDELCCDSGLALPPRISGCASSPCGGGRRHHRTSSRSAARQR